MPGVRRPDFGDVPVGRTGDGIAVCGCLSGVRHHASRGEVAVFHVPDSGPDHHGFARAAVTGSGHLAWIRGGTDVLVGCAAARGVCRRARLAVFSPAFARAFGRAPRWNPGSGFWKFSPVGTGGRLQIGAQA